MSTHRGLVIVCPGVHKAVGIVVVGEVDVGWTPTPSKLQYDHPGCPDGLSDSISNTQESVIDDFFRKTTASLYKLRVHPSPEVNIIETRA